MWQVLIKIVEKFACKHEWVTIVDEYETSVMNNNIRQHKLLMKCKRCGKIKKIHDVIVSGEYDELPEEEGIRLEEEFEAAVSPWRRRVHTQTQLRQRLRL